MFFKAVIGMTLSAAVVFAVTDHDSDTAYTTKPRSLRPQYDQVCKDRKKIVGGYNLPDAINTKGVDLFFSASFILWQPLQDGLSIGYTNSSSDSILGLTNSDGRVIDFNFKYEPGFKLGFGGNVNHGNWDLYLEYTHFHQTSKTGTVLAPNFPTGRIFGSLIPAQGPPGEIQRASGSWRLQLDLLDGVIGKAFGVAPGLSFRPFWGLRGGWLDQRLSAKYFYIADTPVKLTSDSSFIGPRTGIDIDWSLGYGVRFLGSASANLVYTHFKLSWDENTVLNPSTVSTSSKEEHNYLCPHTGLSFGFGWGGYFFKDKFHFDIAATYEFNEFFYQNYMKIQQDGARARTDNAMFDLGVHGLDLTARFDF